MEKATKKIRVFPSTRRRLKIRASKEGKSMGKLIDELEKGKKNSGMSHSTSFTKLKV